MREPLWLARWEMRRTWRSYPWTLLACVIFGAVGSLMWVGAFYGDEASDYVSADIYLLAICSALTANFGSRDSWVGPGTAFPGRVAFFRSLPISARDVVVSRALSRIPVLVLNAAGLFVVPYVFSTVFDGGLSDRVAPATYLWFSVMWVGYALIVGSWVLFGELAMHGGAYNRVQWLVALPVAVALIAFEYTFQPGLTRRMFTVAEMYGPLAAAAALLVGLGAAAIWVRATTRRLAHRDLLA